MVKTAASQDLRLSIYVCYSLGMTMTRSEKNSQTGTLKAIINGKPVQAQSPKLRARMVADHGTATYTPAVYRAERLGRGQMDTSRLDTKIEGRRTAKIRSWRKTSRTA